MKTVMTTNQEIQACLRKLVQAVMTMRRCAAGKDTDCALLCLDSHLAAVYRSAEEGQGLLDAVERAPS